ncbi:hypothetical protein UlMin_028104 [Ulmus minor]
MDNISSSSKKLWEDPLFCSLFLLLLPLVLWFIRNKSKSQLNLPPSPPRLPIVGNLHQLGSFPSHSLRALSNKYGPLMLLHLGQLTTLVVSSADMVREIAKNHDIVFSNRPKATASDILFYGGKDVIFAPYDDCWRQLRKICVLELLTVKRVQSFQSVREEEVAKLVDSLRKAACQGLSVNLSRMLISTSNNIVSRCILGQNYNTEEDGLTTMGDIGRAIVQEIFAFSMGDLFPSLKWIDVLRGFISRLKRTSELSDTLCARVIEEHRKIKANGGDDTKDFVDVLLQLQRDNMHDFELTHVHLKALVQDMLIAGIETSATTLEWLMAELVRNPSVLKKTQEEVRRVVGKKTKVDVNDISSMTYLKCVIKESLRIHPTVPLLVPRETTTSVQIGGYHIPAKTRVVINAFAIQRDPSVWEKPEEFLPERFESNPLDFKGQHYQFIPFGFGRRQCPGLTFGIATIEYLVSNLLYWFDWKLPDDALPEDMDMTEVFGISVAKKSPLHVVPMPYSL